MRLILSGFALLICFADLSLGQIIGIEPRDEKVRAKFQKYLIEREGRMFIPGHVVSGVELSDKEIKRVSKQVVLVVPDPAKPELILVEKNEKGDVKVVAKNREVAINENEIKAEKGMTLLFPHQTVVGLRDEYIKKRAAVDAKRTDLKSIPLGTPEWFTHHRAILVDLDSLVGWLKETLFPLAAKNLEKDYGAELKKAGATASDTRLELAKKSLKTSTLPDDVVTRATDLLKGPPKIHGFETQHFRMHGLSHITESGMSDGIMLAERILEGFRTDHVDPFLTDTETDPIPEGQFSGWFFGPSDEQVGTQFMEQVLGIQLNNPRDRAIKMKGHGGLSLHGVNYFHYWRYDSEQDLPGTVAHQVGHDLAAVIYNRGHAAIPSWMGEGFAYWVSFEFLSRNTVSCVAFDLPSYGKKEMVEGVKPMGEGLRAAFNELALDKGPAMGKLLVTDLVEMAAPELAKSWSVVDWMLTQEHAKSWAFFKAAASNVRDGRRQNLEGLRPTLNELFGINEGVDVYDVIDEQWRRYASGSQKSGSGKRK